MPIFTQGGSVIVTPPPEFSPNVQAQPQYLGLTYVDPDGRTWNLMDLDMKQGILCTDINGISGVPVSLSSVPLVTGGAIPQIIVPQIRTVTMMLFVMALPGTDNDPVGQNAYMTMLDRLTLAFTNVRAGVPAPGTLIVTRPDGSQRQCQVFCTAGIDQPNDSSQTPTSGLLWTTYVLTLTATDPYFYDVTPQEMVFRNSVPQNLIQYWDFEDGTDGWTGGDSAVVSQSSAWASTGTHSLQMHGDGTHSGPQAVSPMFGVSPGQQVTISMDLWAASALTSDVELGVKTFDESGNPVSTSTSSVFSLAATTPTTKTFQYTVPPDGSIGFLEFFFQITGTPASGVTINGDNISVSLLPGILPLLPIVLSGPNVFGDTDVTNGGTADVYPVWTVKGPGTPVVANNTTARTWTLNTPLSDGQTVQVTTTPGQQSVIDLGTGASLWDELVVDTPRDLWPLVPGENNLDLAITSFGFDSEIDMFALFRWLRA